MYPINLKTFLFSFGGRRFAVLLMSAGVVVFSGCVALAPTEGYENFPQKTAEVKMSTSESVLPAEPASIEWPLDLAKCLEIALQNNPEVSAAGWDAKAAESDKQVKQAARWPQVSATGSYFRYQDDQRLVAPTSPGAATYFTTDILSGDVILRMPLYAGGRLVNEVRAADLLLQASEHSLARTREELIFNVTSTYYNILSQKHVIESLEFSREVLSQHLERVHNLIDVKKAAKVDALRTEVRLADLEQQLLVEKNILEIQRRLLANQLGVEAYTPDKLDITGDLASYEADDPETDEILERAFLQRHDYSAAVAVLESQAKRVDIARGEKEPQLSLEATYGGRWGLGGSGEPVAASSRAIGSDTAGNITSVRTTPISGGNSLTTTWGTQAPLSQRYTQTSVEAADNFEDVGRVGVLLEVPLFEGGRLKSQISRERARLNAARQRLRSMELRIRLEVETAILNKTSAQDRVEVSKKSIAEAEESLRIEQQKYDFGKGTIIDVLDAQAALLNAQTNYYRALSDFNIARAQIQLAAGDAEQ